MQVARGKRPLAPALPGELLHGQRRPAERQRRFREGTSVKLGDAVVEKKEADFPILSDPDKQGRHRVRRTQSARDGQPLDVLYREGREDPVTAPTSLGVGTVSRVQRDGLTTAPRLCAPSAFDGELATTRTYLTISEALRPPYQSAWYHERGSTCRYRRTATNPMHQS